MITLAEARARGIELPADDDAAGDIIIEQEAWLARRIGPLEGERTETFYVGPATSRGRLGLRRYTDEVALTDGGTVVLPAHFLLGDNGASVIPAYSAPSWWWRGPYVTATYVPNDADEVRRALFALVALDGKPSGPYASETLGAYSYSKGGPQTPAQIRAAIVASILPQREQATTLYPVSRAVGYGDPVINRAEPVEVPW